jgi:hypothetical protein
MALLPLAGEGGTPEISVGELDATQAQPEETSTATPMRLASDQGPSNLPAGKKVLPAPTGLVRIALVDGERQGEEPAPQVLEVAKPSNAEKIDEMFAVEVSDVVASSAETLQNVTDSIKETFSKLLGSNDVVSSKLLAGLLAPAGGTSIVDLLLGKLSPGGNHRLAQRDRNLKGRWRLGQGPRVLTLVDGRVRLTRQDDPFAAAPLAGFPAGEDPRLASLASGRLLELVRRSPEPAQALAMIQGQLHSLLAGTMPVIWSAWLQALPAALAYPNRLEAWRARTTLKHLQGELAQLGAIDPSLMDVLMAAELATCLEAFEIELLTETDPGEVFRRSPFEDVNITFAL